MEKGKGRGKGKRGGWLKKGERGKEKRKKKRDNFFCFSLLLGLGQLNRIRKKAVFLPLFFLISK